ELGFELPAPDILSADSTGHGVFLPERGAEWGIVCPLATPTPCARIPKPDGQGRLRPNLEPHAVSQARSARLTASGRSRVDRCPHSGTTSSLAPGIPSAISRANPGGVRASSAPTRTSVGQ